jgi:hypothetical protein
MKSKTLIETILYKATQNGIQTSIKRRRNKKLYKHQRWKTQTRHTSLLLFISSLFGTKRTNTAISRRILITAKNIEIMQAASSTITVVS